MMMMTVTILSSPLKYRRSPPAAAAAAAVKVMETDRALTRTPAARARPHGDSLSHGATVTVTRTGGGGRTRRCDSDLEAGCDRRAAGVGHPARLVAATRTMRNSTLAATEPACARPQGLRVGVARHGARTQPQ